ncbi:sigma-70 family RNA polymerase sigma factor [Sphingobacterium sp. SGG-5]|uniref:RNA polymerase sigma factor n=1 Tax=Sphingobacterium sp. SGG-5 TaxID=2710881 RepID=UPI0013EC7B9C|nr:sigma-70 family RNA polymerase sigma factor [Sphingobacterium sp. SGG-5]NGM62653.1 sigma-70 family RNA polymerase sigma factor [Sphingobacterium sp. SGG-5]
MHLPAAHTEIECLHELREGNQQAFTYFYETFKLPIYRKLLTMVRIETIAEELTQDVFVRLWDKRTLIDPQQPFKSYLYRIAQHILYDFYRKVARDERLQRELKLFNTSSYDPISEGVFLKETQSILNQAIACLSEQQSQIFTLCRMEGKSYKEVSEMLGISVHTVSTHMTRASKRVQEFMLKNQHLIWIGILLTHSFEKNILN